MVGKEKSRELQNRAPNESAANKNRGYATKNGLGGELKVKRICGGREVAEYK